MPLITKGKTNIKYILIIILVAAVAGVIIFIEMKNQEKTADNNSASWNNYRSEEHGFEIKYPVSWTFSQENASFIFSSGIIKKGLDRLTCSFILTLAPKGMNEEYVKSLSETKWQKSDAKVSGISAIKLVSANSPINAYYFFENSGIYSFQINHSAERYVADQEGNKASPVFVYNQDCMDIFNQMISTFKTIE